MLHDKLIISVMLFYYQAIPVNVYILCLDIRIQHIIASDPVLGMPILSDSYFQSSWINTIISSNSGAMFWAPSGIFFHVILLLTLNNRSLGLY